MNLLIISRYLDHQLIISRSWNDGIHLLDTGKSILGQNFAKRVSNFFTKWFFFNGSLLSVDHAIDFEIRGKQPRAIVETNLFRLF